MSRAPTHFHGAEGQAATDVVGEVVLGAARFELRRGLMSTVAALEKAPAEALEAAYAAIAAREGFAPHAGYARAVVLREVQREWYERGCGDKARPEPPAVAARRAALHEELRKEPSGDARGVNIVAGTSTARAPRNGPSAAMLIRKGLAEGQSTAEIVAAVKAFNPEAGVDARAVAYYRHQMRKRGELPRKGDA